MKKILFLGFNKKQTKIIDFSRNFKRNIFVKNLQGRVTLKTLNSFDLVVSFGYKELISKEILNHFKKPIINLHLGYLPYNKGAEPNFWSFAENTPSGITIHKIEPGINTGKILYQKNIDFELLRNKSSLTFKKTHKILTNEIENLFMINFENILINKLELFPQIGRGSYHNNDDLPAIYKSANQNIYKTILKYNKINDSIISKKLQILQDIENTRKHNNINWMNIVKNLFKISPIKANKILKSINNDDKKINQMFKKIVKD